jgi:hypothetical protein
MFHRNICDTNHHKNSPKGHKRRKIEQKAYDMYFVYMAFLASSSCPKRMRVTNIQDVSEISTYNAGQKISSTTVIPPSL